MENKICLDTDFLVNFLRKKAVEMEYIRQKEDWSIFAMTMVNLFELYYGAYKSGTPDNLYKVEDLQNRVEILPLSEEATRLAGKMLAELERKGEMLEFRDVLIGAIAVVEGFSIKTNNLRHFQRIPGLKLAE